MSRRFRRRGARAVRMVLYGLAVVHVVEATALRRRRGQVAALTERGGHTAPGSADQLDVVTAADVQVDTETRAATAHEMATSGAKVVDLVPGDLPAVRAMRLLRRVDPGKLAADPLHAPGGAHEAVVLHPTVAGRMAQRPDGGRPPAGRDRATRAELVRHTMLAQRYAPTSAALRVAPRLRAGRWTAQDRWQELDEVTAFARRNFSAGRVLLGLESAHLLAMTAGLLVAPVAAGAALATWSLQPMLVFAGQNGRGANGMLPPDVGRASLRRLPETWAENVGATVAARDQARTAWAARPQEPEIPLPSEVELFDPRRDTCPWCGASDIVGLVDAAETSQFKPGTFHLDECRRCGHVFQNPALSLRGLDYYYDQAYDGEGEASTEMVFGSLGPVDRMRVQAVGQFTRPQSWLDVGTGFGHFCVVARHELPDTVFDGLDVSEGVEEGQRRGWVDTAYRGLFPELADGLPRSYDVVSMHHYLEHTREPRRELAAAAKVLAPGGHLMIEVPDPADPWSRRAGRFWLPWYQPQHQHFITCENLAEALEDAGFEVVSVERGTAHMGGLDLASTAGLIAQTLAGPPNVPWRPASEVAHPARRFTVFALAAPVIAAALLADVVRDARIRQAGTSRAGNTYRVVARRV